MLRSLISIGIFTSLCFNYTNAQISSQNLMQALSGIQTNAQGSSPSSDLKQGLVNSVVQQATNQGVAYPGETLTKQGAWYIFQNGDWKPITQNDNLKDMNIALLIHDLVQDRTNLRSFAAWLASISKDPSTYNPSTSLTASNSTSCFQAILAFEYPSTKSLENKNEQPGVISAVAEAFAPQLILGAKNVTSVTIFAHGIGGLIGRYALQGEFPNLISKNQNDYKDIFKKIRLITLGTPHEGVPSQVSEIAYKNFIQVTPSSALTSTLNQQAQNYLSQNQTKLLGQQTSGIIGLIAPGLLPNNFANGLNLQNSSTAFPVVKELEPNSTLLNFLNQTSFSYADQTDYITIAGNKSTELQIGTPNATVEVGTAIQTLYSKLSSDIASDGLVAQSSAHAKELEKYCTIWAKNNNDRKYTVNANHFELISGETNQNFIQHVVPTLIKIFSIPIGFSSGPAINSDPAASYSNSTTTSVPSSPSTSNNPASSPSGTTSGSSTSSTN